MRLSSVIDPLAEWLLELRKVSATQWMLRSLGVLATIGAALLANPGGIAATVFAMIAVPSLTVALLVQIFQPDSDIGILAPAAIIASLLGQPELTVMRAALIGIVLLVAHMAWALAATAPAHGVLRADVWALTGRTTLLVLAVAVVAGLLVVLLAGIDLGPWMVVAGVLATVALLVLMLPRQR